MAADSSPTGMPTVYLNGEWLPLDKARIPVNDRGFLFGDGVYEVIPVYDRMPFRENEHLARLQYSLDGIQLQNPHSIEAWRSLIGQIVALAPWPDQGIYLQVTRGPGPRDHAFPQQPHPTVFILPLPLTAPAPTAVAEGVSAITAQDIRWLRCDLKTTSLLPNVLLRQESVAAGCAETLLLRDGCLLEGSASSVFIVLDGVLLAPPQSHLILPGITHDIVVELARDLDMPHRIRDIPEHDLRRAQEIWITSSTKEVLAVTRLDGEIVGDGHPGPQFRRMYAAYQSYKRRVMRREAAT